MDLPAQTKRRKRYSNREKLALLRRVRRRIAREGLSKSDACKDVGITLKMHNDWNGNATLMSERNPLGKSLGVGTSSALSDCNDELLRHVFELREQGIGVTVNLVMLRASQLSRQLREKPTRVARYHSVRRWLVTHGYVHRMGTHVAQKSPSETAAEASDYMETVRPKVANRNKDYVYNMDQTPVFFALHRKKTLEKKGNKTVNVRSSNTDTKRMTVGVTITASGRKLSPYCIFKGAPNARIARTEFPYYPKSAKYACQKNAWMDEECMLDWVQTVLKPDVDTAPDDVDPILFLDSYRCHMMTSVVHAIEELGVEVVHIPGGCTSLTQPVDVGFNKPFKNRMRDLWEAWLVTDGIVDGKATAPTRQLIAGWIDEAFSDIPVQIIQNAWLHGAYAYFVPTVANRVS